MAKKQQQEEDLAKIIAESLNETVTGDDKVAFFLENDESPTDLKDFISTGSSLLDLAISNRPHAGIACGRITEINGLEGTGKSLIAAHMMANVQKEGGVAVLIDTEAAVNSDFFNAVGVNMKELLYLPAETVEQIFELIEKVIEKTKEYKNKTDKKVIIVVDSLAAASTKGEIEADYDKSGYGTDKSKLLSQAMRKITNLIAREKIALVFTNQLRQKLNAPAFSDPWTTPGGKAIGFHASTRIRLAQISKIKNKDDNIVGITVKASIIKSRLGPPYKVAEFDIYFDRGIDDISSWLEFLKDKSIVSGTSGRYTFIDASGTEHKFQTSTWSEFADKNPMVVEEIYTKMCDAMVMVYSSKGVSSTEPESMKKEEGDSE